MLQKRNTFFSVSRGCHDITGPRSNRILRAAQCLLALDLVTHRFKLLHDQIPTSVGNCLVDEHYNPVNGDSLQETTGGLMVWRKIDNFTAFTDGYRTWVNGPFGVQQRLNTEKFDWEPVAPPAPPPAPVPAPVPVPPPPPAPAAPAPTPVPQLEQAPTIIGPGDATHVGESAKLEWDWYRGLKDNEEFLLVRWKSRFRQGTGTPTDHVRNRRRRRVFSTFVLDGSRRACRPSSVSASNSGGDC